MTLSTLKGHKRAPVLLAALLEGYELKVGKGAWADTAGLLVYREGFYRETITVADLKRVAKGLTDAQYQEILTFLGEGE